MKTIVLFLTIFAHSTILLHSQQNIKIKTTVTSSYCKGAAPEPGELTLQHTPQFSEMTVYFYQLDSAEFGSETISESNQAISLIPGKYVISFAPFTQGQLTEIIEPRVQLMSKRTSNHDANVRTIEVTDQTKELIINYHHYCSWQLDPTIPPPP